MRYFFAIVTAAALAAEPAVPQTFEVASVRKHQGTDVFRSGPLEVSGPLIRLQGYTIYGLILDAWNTPGARIKIVPGAIGSPEDIYDTMYDVVARAPGDRRPALDDVRTMLRNLLAERFDLRAHIDTAERPVYALTVEKGGAKLRRASGTTPCEVQTEGSADGRNEHEAYASCDMEDLAEHLTGLLNDPRDNAVLRPVVNSTGLTGSFNFSLFVVPRWRTRVSPDPADVSPLEAVRSLGLKLSERKAPVKMLSIDHLGKLKENE
jgi:uncharacterized protein (TIGR03435 family)